MTRFILVALAFLAMVTPAAAICEDFPNCMWKEGRHNYRQSTTSFQNGIGDFSTILGTIGTCASVVGTKGLALFAGGASCLSALSGTVVNAPPQQQAHAPSPQPHVRTKIVVRERIIEKQPMIYHVGGVDKSSEEYKTAVTAEAKEIAKAMAKIMVKQMVDSGELVVPPPKEQKVGRVDGNVVPALFALSVDRALAVLANDETPTHPLANAAKTLEALKARAQDAKQYQVRPDLVALSDRVNNMVLAMK